MKRKLLYASDLDRTLIFSKRFIDEHPTDAKYSATECIGPRIISYMADEVREELHKIRDIDNVLFVPVTTRSIEEYNRVSLGFIPEYAIVANGAVILHNGEPMKEWADYIRKGINKMDILDIISDIKDCLESVSYEPKLIDGSYIFFKTDDEVKYDDEIGVLINDYPDWQFTRQSKKCYAIPKHFSKQIALRWLWHELNQPYIVASGDSELDLPMLTLADRAIIPAHGSLVKDGFVTGGTLANGGITSPLFTMKIVKEEIDRL